jgi:hypothetical protein
MLLTALLNSRSLDATHTPCLSTQEQRCHQQLQLLQPQLHALECAVGQTSCIAYCLNMTGCECSSCCSLTCMLFTVLLNSRSEKPCSLTRASSVSTASRALHDNHTQRQQR